jgi:hypothetical protein
MKMSLSNSLSGLLLGLLLLFGSPSGARAADFEVIGAYGQIQTAIATHDHYAYVAGGCNLRVLDIADPAHPKPIGYLRLENDVTHMLLKWPALYVAQPHWGGLWVVDVSDPRHPHRVGEPLEGLNPVYECDAKLDGNFLLSRWSYRASAWVEVFNLATPLHPRCVMSLHNYAEPPSYDFFISGSRLLVARITDDDTTRALVLEDCSTSPSRTLSRYPLGAGDFPFKLNYDQTSAQLGWQPGKQVVKIGEFKSGQTYLKLHVDHGIDYSDIKIDSPITTAPTLAWHQNLAIGQLKVADRIAYAVKGAGLSIINCRQPEKPTLITSVTLAAPITTYGIEDRALYAATSAGRLEILDTKNLASPQPAGSIAITSPTVSMASSEKHLYLLSPQAGLQIYELPTWSKPVAAGIFKPSSPAFDLATSGTLVYLLSNEALTVIDVRDAKQPKQIAQLALQWKDKNSTWSDGDDELSDQPAQLKRVGSYLYIFRRAVYHTFSRPSVCLIISASDPLHPTLTARFDTNTPIRDLTKSESPQPPAKPIPSYSGYTLALPDAWSSNQSEGFNYLLYDLADPLQPTLVKILAGRESDQVVIGRNMLYLPTGEGLLVLQRRK